MKKPSSVGIIAFQGDVSEHAAIIRNLGYVPKEVRAVSDLIDVSHVIIPGGESPVISAFLQKTMLGEEIGKRVRAGELAVFGTCAGAIVLSKKVLNARGVAPLALIDVTTKRNAYGSQLDSFAATIHVKGIRRAVDVSFIRAPRIVRVGSTIKVLASVEGEPIIAASGRVLISTCHPEMRGETAIHELFLSM